MKNILIIILLISSITAAQTGTNQIASMPGAFSRAGFGARGIAMGNSLSSVNSGNVFSYYNPALSVFQEKNSFQTSYTFLSMDRSLNFLSFTRKFELSGKIDTTKRKSKPAAGLSFGIINSGVSKIDGRDNQGFQTGELSTSENQFLLNVSNRFSDKLALGLNVKFYYYKLYEDIKADGLGFDFGALYMLNKNINLSFGLTDINSKYKWDSTPIFQTEGRITENKFPFLKKIGLSYKFNRPNLITAIEFENSNAGTNYLRMGTEYNLIESFTLRAGIDRLNLSNSEEPIRPSAGFSFYKNVRSFLISVDYAFAVEPYSSGDKHILGINFVF